MPSMRRVLIEHQDDDSSPEKPFVPIQKDTWYSWIVCGSCFSTQVFILGVLHAFGVFFVEFIRTFKSSQSQAAWVGSLAYGLSMTFGPVCSALVNRFGCRIVMVAGCLICSISVFATSFVETLSQMYGSFSLFYGFGTCLCISPIMTIAPDYFDKYVTVAVGIITAGSSIGTLIMAPLSQVLIDIIGWRNTFRFFSGTCIFSAVCCAFVKPAKKKSPIQKIRQSPARQLMQELKLWKNRVFVVWTMAITCVMFGFYIPYVHLVSYAITVGVSPEKGSILVMILGGCTAFGRIFFGKVVQSGILNRLHMHQLSMVVTGTGVMLLPLIKSFEGIIAYVLCVGLVDGCYVVLLPVLTTSLVGAENAVFAWGFLVGTSSITFTLGPPVAGALYDAFGSYNVAFHCAGIPIICGALLLLLIPWAQRTSQTNNIMITVSNDNITDEYDFVEDLLEEQEDNTRTDCSAVTLREENSEVDHADISTSVVSPRSPRPRRTYKDQSTLTSPGSRINTGDMHQALALLHENARLLANILDQKKEEIEAGRKSQTLKSSTKSRSEMIQVCDSIYTLVNTFALDTVKTYRVLFLNAPVNDNMAVLTTSANTSNDLVNPTGVMSIMSVPGGFAVGHMDPQRPVTSAGSQFASSSYHYEPYQPSFPASQSHVSTTSSLQSRFAEQLGASPNSFLLPQFVSPEQKTIVQARPAGQTSESSSYSGSNADVSNQQRRDPLSSFDQVIQQGVEMVRETILKSPQQDQAVEMNEQTSETSDEIHAQATAQHRTSGITSPLLTSPRLSSIPEVTIKEPETIQPHAEIQDQWWDSSPNDPNLFHPEIRPSAEALAEAKDSSSSIASHKSKSGSTASSPSHKSLGKSESNASSHQEIDVFTHLFDDNDV